MLGMGTISDAPISSISWEYIVVAPGTGVPWAYFVVWRMHAGLTA